MHTENPYAKRAQAEMAWNDYPLSFPIQRTEGTSPHPEAEPAGPTFRERVERGELTNEQLAEHVRQGIGPDANQIPAPEALQQASDALYGFLRQGIDTLAEESGSTAVPDLLRRSLPYTRIKRVGYLDKDGVAADYNSDSTTLRVHRTKLGAINDFAYKNPADAKLLYYAYNIMHEMGHAMDSGVGEELTKTEAARSAWLDGHLYVSEVYLMRHPEKGLTGRLPTDFDAIKERVAETTAAIGLPAFMRTIGYSTEEIADFQERIAHKPDFGHAWGHNQIDFLRKVSAAKGPEDMVGKNAPAQQKLSAQLGYTKPLKNSELMEMLEEAAALKPGEFRAGKVIWADWHDQSKAKREPDTMAYIDRLRQERGKVVRKDLMRKVGPIIGFAGMAAVGLATFGPSLANHHETPPPLEYPADSAVDRQLKIYEDAGYPIIVIPDKPAPGGVRLQVDPDHTDAEGRETIYFYPK